MQGDQCRRPFRVPTVLAAASYLRKAHVDLLVIQGLLGHESVATTEIYPRVSAARQRQAIQALEGGIVRSGYLPPPGGQ
jgi:integrase